jgi:hypothetical protein
LATALAALKTHAAATAIIGTLVVGGGAATVAVATGAVHMPGSAPQTQGSTQQPSGADHAHGTATAGAQRAQACTSNGDAARLAAIYAPMFGNAQSTAQHDICTLFAGSGHQVLGLGQVQLMLETAAAIERNGGNAGCLAAAPANGQPTPTGKPANPGKPDSAGTPAAGQVGAQATTVPSASASDTETIIGAILKADPTGNGTPLAQLARACGATATTGNPNGGAGDGPPTTVPGGEPTHTPGARPTSTPGHP